MSFQVSFATKWADFDPNRHMRHTAYNDYAAEVRVRYFAKNNFSIDEFTRHNLGPILFKEETSFRKEIHLGDSKLSLVLFLKALVYFFEAISNKALSLEKSLKFRE